jgi:phosphatidate cytidylyltransferase
MEVKSGGFLLRTLSGLVWAGVFLFCAWFGSTWRWAILLALCIIGGVYELRSLTKRKGKAIEPFLSGLGAFVILVGAWFRGAEGLALGAMAAVVFNSFVILRRKYEGALELLTRGVFTSFYLGLGTGAAVLLGRGDAGGELLVVTLGTLWTADTGAYVVGSLLGRRQLTPEISPKKTVEGLVASVILAGAAAWALEAYLFDAGLRGRYTIVLGVLVALAALLGDLAVSAVKRDLGVKDTGSLIPGHGGLLDRLDSFLVVMPTAYLYFVSLHHAGLWDGFLG